MGSDPISSIRQQLQNVQLQSHANVAFTWQDHFTQQNLCTHKIYVVALSHAVAKLCSIPSRAAHAVSSDCVSTT
jgi:hypothetical protein